MNRVNLTLDHGELIIDGGIMRRRHPLSPLHRIRDLYALRVLFALGRREGWELAISPITYDEIVRTSNDRILIEL